MLDTVTSGKREHFIKFNKSVCVCVCLCVWLPKVSTLDYGMQSRQ